MHFKGHKEEKMESETITIEFAKDDLELIQLYQKATEATSMHNAIMNAVSLMLDYVDE